jgi:UDP-N-acetylmuramate--alanine ligase
MNEPGYEQLKPIQRPHSDYATGEGPVEVLKDVRLHFMGIGGQGISAVAQMALMGGARVTGCDQSASATTKMLERAGIPVEIGHSLEHLSNADVLIYVPAVVAFNPDNPELVAAKASGIPAMIWQEMMGKWMRDKCVLSVSGVHGKGTTTAMLALMLVDAGLDPTCEIGAIVPRFGVNYRIGKSQYFVNEADEFNNNFWHYHPRLAIVTSIEFEHPEFFANYADYLEAFEHFIRGMDLHGDWPFPPTLVLNIDSPGCLELRERLSDWPGRIITYAVEDPSSESRGTSDSQRVKERATFAAFDVKLDGETSFRVRSPEKGGRAFPVDREIHLHLPGAHNIQNALAALAAAHSIGLDDDVIVRTLESFSGIGRRFEIRHQGPLEVNGAVQDVILIDDYAHHPTAISATLEAARRRFPERRLIAVYQPHMYSRTKTFFEQFLTAFDSADVVIIADIFPGREHDTGLIHANELVEGITKRPPFSSPGKEIFYGGDVQSTAKLLGSTLRSGDLAIIMGAGDVYSVTEMLLGSLPTSPGEYPMGQVS